MFPHLEPFDTSSWMLVALVAIQAAALSIYMFEWFSPIGNNQSKVTIWGDNSQFGQKIASQETS